MVSLRMILAMIIGDYHNSLIRGIPFLTNHIVEWTIDFCQDEPAEEELSFCHVMKG